MKKRKLHLAIDLGTTNSLAGVQSASGNFVFFNPDTQSNSFLVPSLVLCLSAKECQVGQQVHRSCATKTSLQNEVISSVKRLMKHDHERTGDNGLSSNEIKLSPSEASGRILQALKEAAERDLAENPSTLPDDVEYEGAIDSAVITVPAYFGERERRATRKAARHAGFKGEVRLLDEPVAAALSMNLHEKPGARTIMVLDLGGGTCDVTVIRAGQDVESGGFLELGRVGNNELGGDDFDELLASRLIEDGPLDEYPAEIENELRYPPDGIRRDLRLREEVEQGKQTLCNYLSESGEGAVDLFWTEPKHRKEFISLVTTDWFRKESEKFIEYVAQLCDFLLSRIDRDQAGLQKRATDQRSSDTAEWANIGIDWSNVDELCLVGGGSLMPHLQERLLKRLGGEKYRDKLTIPDRPQYAVAEGAAVYADLWSRGQLPSGIAKTRCPVDIGIMCLPDSSRSSSQGNGKLSDQLEFRPLIHSNAQLDDPKSRECRFTIPIIGDPATSSKPRLNVEICQRFISGPNGNLDDDSDAISQDAGHGLQYSVRKLKRLSFRNVPPAKPGEENVAIVTLTYRPNHSITVEGKYRNIQDKKKIDEDELNQDS